MIAAMHAEFIRFGRARRLALIGGIVTALGVFGAVLTFATAVTSPRDLVGQEKLITTLAALAHPGGATHGFVASTSLIGIVVGVVAAATLGSDYALGTLRPLLVRHPKRISLILGKLLAFTVLVATALAVTELAALAVSIGYAHVRGVPTTQWFGASGLSAATVAYAKALFICVAWQAFGAAAGVLARSLTVAVIAVVVWAVPVERILGSSLSAAPHWLPGLMLEALSNGDTATASTGRVLALVTAYSVILLAVALLDFRRRDVTA
jgi:ABC-type transport system involved in multi-copper enzyme maturation permease subunit